MRDYSKVNGQFWTGKTEQRFHTARQRVAPGAEKQEMPACLPVVSFLRALRGQL